MSEYIMESVPFPIIRKESQLVMRGEIVRCRDCWHYDAGSCYADQWSTASLMPPHRVTPYGFCAWGERK